MCLTKRSLSSRGAGFPRSIGKAQAQKGSYFVHNQELFFASPNIQVCVHENKEWGELNTSAQKCTAKQFSTGSRSDLLSWKGRRFPRVQVHACSRLTLGMPLPCRNGGGCLPVRQGWNHLSGGERGVPFPARPGPSGRRCRHEGEENLGLISRTENT